MKKPDYEIDLLEYLMQLKCYDDGSYDKALNFAKKSTRTGRIMVKTVSVNAIPMKLSKSVFNAGKVFYQRYEIIGKTNVMKFGCPLPVNIVIYELR